MREQNNVWVIFSGKSDIWWLRWLQPGFRHCFILFEKEDSYGIYDPLLHQTELSFFYSSKEEILSCFYNKGYVIVSTKIQKTKKTLAPISLYNCVEAVKRMLGIHDRWVFTPWQLYKKLIKMEKSFIS